MDGGKTRVRVTRMKRGRSREEGDRPNGAGSGLWEDFDWKWAPNRMIAAFLVAYAPIAHRTEGTENIYD